MRRRERMGRLSRGNGGRHDDCWTGGILELKCTAGRWGMVAKESGYPVLSAILKLDL